jgi:pimeloyl-ACP methyl ester carboxylesterase
MVVKRYSYKKIQFHQRNVTVITFLFVLIIPTVSVNSGNMIFQDEDILSAREDSGGGYEPLGANGTNPPIDLYYGWNLVSFPYIVSDTSVEEVLSSINGKYDKVQTYDPWDEQDPWKHNHIAKPSSQNDLTDLNNSQAFWVHVTVPSGTDLVVEGDTPSSQQSISLNAGWNLVGYPSESQRLRYDALYNLNFSRNLDIIQFFNATEKTWYEMTSSDSFEPGRGYWIHAKRDITWRLPMQDPPYMTPGIHHFYKYKGQELVYYVPHTYITDPDSTRILFVIHGAGRNYEHYFDMWIMEDVPETYNVVLIAPLFDEENFIKYQRLNVGYGERADLRLIDLFDNFTQWLNITHDTFYIYGFSGGGQFTHRFVMAHPEYIERAVAAGSGVYTFPNASIAYSHGINLTEYEPIDLEFDLQKAFLANMSIMVGLNDTERSGDLSQSNASDAQGLNRLERARNFINATTDLASEKVWELNYNFQEVADCGHKTKLIRPCAIDYMFV